MKANIKKLLQYQYECIRQSIKASSFNNLESNKENKILIIEGDIFKGDNKNIIDMMTKYALNKSNMSLLYSELFIKGNKIYSPIVYCTAELIRENDKIILKKDENFELNVGVIANLCEGEEEKIENIMSQLLNVDCCDLPTVMNGLLNMEDIEIIKQRAIILAKMPDATAGLLNELKTIAELY